MTEYRDYNIAVKRVVIVGDTRLIHIKKITHVQERIYHTVLFTTSLSERALALREVYSCLSHCPSLCVEVYASLPLLLAGSV